MVKKFDNLVKFGSLIVALGLLASFLFASGGNEANQEAISKAIETCFLILVIFMFFDWIANCINTIILGKGKSNNKMVLLGYGLLAFPLIELLFIGIMYFSKHPEGAFLILPITFLVGIPMLLLTDEKPVRGNNWFKISYYAFSIMIPFILVLWMKPPEVSSAHRAKAKATADQMRSAAELFRISNEKEDYSGLESHGGMNKLIVVVNETIGTTNGLLLSPDKKGWCFKFDLSGEAGYGEMWCVDSNGFAGNPTDKEYNCNTSTGNYSCR